MKGRYFIAVSLCALFYPMQVSGGFMSGFLQICLFSEVRGVVTENGKPRAGLTVIRKSLANGSEYINKTRTNDSGEFYFEPEYSRSINKLLPTQPVIKQQIIIQQGDREYIAWKSVKKNYEEGGELKTFAGGEKSPIDLSCELTDPPSYKETDFNIIHGICKLN